MGWNARVRMGLLVAVVGAGMGRVCAQEAGGVDAAGKKLAGAEGLLARGQYALARQEFDEFLKMYPQDGRVVQARYERAVSEFNLNDTANAVADLTTVTAAKDFAKRDEALSLLGTAYLQQGAVEKALATFDVLVKEYPQSAQVESAQVNRAQALYRLGRSEQSLDAVRALLKGFPASAYRGSALYVGAIDQRNLGDEKEAERTLREVVGSYPNSPFVYDAELLLGESLAAQGRVEESLAYYRKVEGEAPESRKTAVRFGLASVLMRAGRFAEAEQAFGQIAAGDAAGAYGGPASLQAAVAKVKAGRRDEGRAALIAVEGKYPALNGSAGYWLARCDLLDGKYAEAGTQLQRLVGASTPEAADVEFDLAFCELRLNHDAVAVQRLEAFRAKYPRSGHVAEALYYEASALFNQGEFAKSVEFASAVDAYGETSVRRPAGLLRGEGLLMQKQYGAADAVFGSLEPGATSDEEKLRLAYRRGQCAYFSGDFASAEARLTEVVKSAMRGDPAVSDASFLLGDAQLQQGKDALAEGTLKEYLAAAGGGEDAGRVQEATFKLATAQEHLKEDGEAAHTLRGIMGKAGDLKTPWAQRAWYEYGQLAFGRGDTDEAAGAMEKVLAAKPEGAIAAPAMYLLARIEMAGGKNHEAAARLAALGESYPHDALAQDAMFVRGMALKNDGHADLAERQFAVYLQAYPSGKFVTEARHQRAVALAGTGTKEAAAEAVRILTDLAKPGGSGRNDSVLYDLAWAYRSAGDEGRAMATYAALIQEFPQGVQAMPARVEAGQLLYGQKKYGEAAALLEPVLADARTEPRLRGVAQYWAASCAARLGDDAKAAREFDTFAGANPRDPLAAEALSEAGVSYANRGKMAEAEQHQRKVIGEYAGSEAASLAMIRLGETQNQAGDYAGAEGTFAAWMQGHAGGTFAARALFGIGWSLENRGKLEEARAKYAAVIAADNGEFGARAQFQTGETYFSEKRYDQAARELLKVDILYSAPAWAARALYEAGRAFEQLKDVASAKQQFAACVSKYKDSDVAPLAQKRLEALNGAAGAGR